MTMPSNLIIGGASTAGQPTVKIPGLSGDPDIPTGPYQFSDEFDQNAAGVPAGWTAFGAPDAVDTNSSLSQVHIANNNNNTNTSKGIYRALPALTYPITVTYKVSEAPTGGIVGVMISPVAPGSAGTGYGEGYAAGTQGMVQNMSALSLVGNGNNSNIGQMPSYQKLVMADSTHMAIPQYSLGGMAWQLCPAAVAEVLSGAAAFICLYVNTLNVNGASADFDFVRIQ